MAIKNTDLGGTDWVDGEVLYSADLNDTFDEAAKALVFYPFSWGINATQWFVGGMMTSANADMGGGTNFTSQADSGDFKYTTSTGDIYVESLGLDTGNIPGTDYTKVMTQASYQIMSDRGITDSAIESTSYDTTKNYYQDECQMIVRYHENRVDGGTYGYSTTGFYITDGSTWSSKLFSAGGNSCFLGKQLLTYADGTQKPIEEVKKGDAVLSWNEEDDSFKPSIVNEIQIKNHSNLYELHLEDGKILYPTANHPFWIKGKKWATASGLDELNMGADILVEGDYVYSTDKKWIKVEKIIGIDGEFKTYNLLDMDYGTFVVDNIVVHNSGNVYISAQLKFNGTANTVDVYKEFSNSGTAVDLSGLTSNWYVGLKATGSTLTSYIDAIYDDEGTQTSTVQEKIANRADIVAGSAYLTATNLTPGTMTTIDNPGRQGKFTITFTDAGGEVLIVRNMGFKMFY